MAPEYLNRGIITKELDIFSLGVIIIQVVTGRKHYPYNDDETSSQEFIELVSKLCFKSTFIVDRPFPAEMLFLLTF
jgi:serine/threonine protein kinase